MSKTQDPLLQEFVIPICQVKLIAGGVNIEKLFGTAFFINANGVFLTAKHVIENAAAATNGYDIRYGLITKSDTQFGKSVFVWIQEFEFAPHPFDVAIGIANPHSKCFFSIPTQEKIEGWQDVATFGYPETAINIDVEKFNIHLRHLKGYIQRPIPADELPVGRPHPDSFELSFPITNGLSGSPLFIPKGSVIQEIVGVCVKSFESEIVIDSVTDIDESGKVLTEKRAKVEQYGIAESIFPLLDWTPKLLGGKSIRQTMTPK